MLRRAQHESKRKEHLSTSFEGTRMNGVEGLRTNGRGDVKVIATNTSVDLKQPGLEWFGETFRKSKKTL
jgi:hypothetical protein